MPPKAQLALGAGRLSLRVLSTAVRHLDSGRTLPKGYDTHRSREPAAETNFEKEGGQEESRRSAHQRERSSDPVRHPRKRVSTGHL
jgi:hypothetical protein